MTSGHGAIAFARWQCRRLSPVKRDKALALRKGVRRRPRCYPMWVKGEALLVLFQG